MLDYSRHNDPQAFSGGCSTQRETRCACTACKQRNIEHRRAQIEHSRPSVSGGCSWSKMHCVRASRTGVEAAGRRNPAACTSVRLAAGSERDRVIDRSWVRSSLDDVSVAFGRPVVCSSFSACT